MSSSTMQLVPASVSSAFPGHLQVLKWPRNISTTNIYNHVILIQFECISDGFQLPTKFFLCPSLLNPFADNPISCGHSPAQHPTGRSGRKTTGHCLSSGKEWPSTRASLCAESSPGFSCSRDSRERSHFRNDPHLWLTAKPQLLLISEDDLNPK